MITADKLRIFNRYNGDVDGWRRIGSKSEKIIITDHDWFTIDSFIQDLFLLNQGLNSSEFNNVLNNKLKEICDSEETIMQLKKIVICKKVL